MNHWKETTEIFSRLAALGTSGETAALATVVSIDGSAYRRPGAKLLIEDDGDTIGGVSAGCLEADVRLAARSVVATATSCLRHYDTGEEDLLWGLGLGCSGAVDIYVQPATSGPLATIAGRVVDLLAGDATVALATVVSDGPEVGATIAIEFPIETPPGAFPASVHGSLGSPDLDHRVAACARESHATGRSAVHRVAGRQIFVELLTPPPHLLVFGAGSDARSLVAYASDVGFRVTLVDHREALLDPKWFPHGARRITARPDDESVVLPSAARSLAVVMMHSLAYDRGWIRRLLAAGVPYIGVLGPRRRTESILRGLRHDGSDTGAVGGWTGGAANEDRVYGPVGLDLGADGPQQVAISIVAELLAITAKREPRHLSKRHDAIHTR